MSKPKNNHTPIAEENQLTKAQDVLLTEVIRKRGDGTIFKIKKLETGEIANANAFPELDAQMLRTFGTADRQCALTLLMQLAAAHPDTTSDKNTTTEVINNLTPLVHGIAPQDELEGMLAVQSVAIHNLSMEVARKAANEKTTEGLASCVNSLTKLNRTFTSQMEALGKYRNRGQQKVVVEHVNIGGGGQAVIGNVNQGGR
jgi:hypothetical protein